MIRKNQTSKMLYDKKKWPLCPPHGTLRFLILEQLLEDEFVVVTYPPSTQDQIYRMEAVNWLSDHGWLIEFFGVGIDPQGNSLYQVRLTPSVPDKIRAYVLTCDLSKREAA